MAKSKYAPTKAPNSISDYLVQVSPSALVLTGVGLMANSWFLAGVCMFYLGIALLAIQIWNLLRTYHWTTRIIGVALYVNGVACSLIWVFVPGPMQIQSRASVPRYTPNLLYQGIRWLSAYSELDLAITNTGNVDYDNFFAAVTTDLDINELRQVNGLVTCGATTAVSFNQVIVQHFENSKPVGTPGIGGVDVGTYRQNYAVVPIFPNGMAGLQV